MPTMFLAALAAVASPDQQARSEVAEKAADARDKVVCKRFARTGSLVGGYRSCKTKWEWERERENVRSPVGGIDSCRTRAEPDPILIGGGCGA